MRVTPSTLFDQITTAIQNNTAELSQSVNQLSTGKRLQKPSDDVTGTENALDYKVSIDANNQYQSNAANLNVGFNYTNNVLSTVADTLSSITQIAQSVSGTMSSDQTSALAGQVSDYRDQILNLANSTFQGGYLFSGFKTDTQPYDTSSYAYQGDSGTKNVMIGAGDQVAANFTGSDTFSNQPETEQVVQMSDGTFVHYIPGTGTTTNVEIRAADDTTVVDTFSYDNFIQMTDVLKSALQSNNTARIRALGQPLTDATSHIRSTQAELGIRQNAVADQQKRLSDSNLSMQNALSKIEDADMPSTITAIMKMSTAIQALEEASSRILSQSLLDFLK